MFVAYPIDTLDSAANAYQLVPRRRTGGNTDALCLLSPRGCLHAVVCIIAYVESRVPRC